MVEEGGAATAIAENGDGSLDQRIDGEKEHGGRDNENVLRFLDSLDGYLTLMDSLNSKLREGWLDLASARHSMGASRINSALLDLKFHPAATLLQVTEKYEAEPQFTLCKWASADGGKMSSEDAKSKEDKHGNSILRHRGNSGEKLASTNANPQVVDDQVKKERSKSLSVFGAFVSPKLRSAQISFETALETLVEVANLRSSMLSAFDLIKQEPKNLEKRT